MKEFDFVTYMEMLATKLKSLKHDPETSKHFFKVQSLINLDEVLQNLNSAQFPALCVIDSPEGRLMDKDSTNLLDLQYYYFFVIDKADIDDAASRKAAIDGSKAIIKQLLGRMFRDRASEQRNPLALPCYGLKNLNRDSLSYKAVGPIADNCYGMWASFTLLNGANINYNADDWEE